MESETADDSARLESAIVSRSGMNDANDGMRTTDERPAPTAHTAARTMNVLSIESKICEGFIDGLSSLSAAVYSYFFHNTGENNSNTVKISRRPMSMTTVITHLATTGKLA